MYTESTDSVHVEGKSSTPLPKKTSPPSYLQKSLELRDQALTVISVIHYQRLYF